MFIYLIVNHKTGKYYVGQHKGNKLRKYLQQKFHHAQKGISSNSRLYRSMRAHPLPSIWSIHALRSDIQTREELDQTERDFIAFLKAQDPKYGYNICRGGEGFTGPHTEETRHKIARISEELWKRPGHRENFSAKMKGHPTSPKTIEKIKVARATQDEVPRIKGCRKYAEEHTEEMSARLSHEAHVLGGKSGSKENKQRAGRLGYERGGKKAQHTRWHVNRERMNLECPLCIHLCRRRYAAHHRGERGQPTGHGGGTAERETHP